MSNLYDLIILGAGPAGLACSIYASRFKIKHLVIGKVFGGTITEGHVVENYPGIISISGQKLAQRFLEHARSYGAEIVEGEVIEIRNVNGLLFNRRQGGDKQGFGSQDHFEVVITDRVFLARTLFLGLGTKVRRLNIPGEEEFLGRGVSYCATCDAPLFRGKRVVVIGGGDSAVTAALHLAEFAKKVFLIYRGKKLSAEPIWQEKLFAHEKVRVILETNIIEVKGERIVSQVVLDKVFEGAKSLKVDGVSIEIGAVPAAELIKNLGIKVERGLIKINPEGATNVKGVWAGGDIASAFEGKESRQIVNAVSEGASAAISIYKYLKTIS